MDCDANGHVLGSAHANPILDTMLYQVKLQGRRLQSQPPKSLQNQYMPSVMQMGMSICS